ncbi:Putative uncharacterized protein [Taphrina deformans PYCC 5710]|uniref:Uncharacterized protein n=1 Tax=Taphrina deformans (strain PYCC 5710 / ATCC 11124 / CBS 356.35 / IMI 108563 / JCM 9778 / NBRC 8474) TaxID=1097556 RepID=R4X6E8_TAPDE|nr:Putative uncharacterized protein [Taphrina deformans PYCC 5710]|eukprot:CCG80630.1 Putative uncharacterized protein [Taphrina deformans PYCC 5710]
MYRRNSYDSVAIPEEHISKFAVALILEFEARVYLNSWAELSLLVEDAAFYQLSCVTYSNMANLILSCRAPVDAVFEVIEAITNTAIASKQRDISQVSRWLRMTFTLCLNLRDHAESYPMDELQWLVARSFNQAVDSYSAGDHDRCHRLCELALNIGNYVQDAGLRTLVQRNYQQMINSM